MAKRQKKIIKGRWSVASGQWSVVSGQSSGLHPQSPLCLISWVFLCIVFVSLWGCSSTPVEIKDEKPFKSVEFESKIPYVTPELLRIYDANLNREYLIGPGDVLKIGVWKRPDLVGKHVVGPHGLVTLPMVGVFKIGGLSRDEAAKAIKNLYLKYYADPLVTG